MKLVNKYDRTSNAKQYVINSSSLEVGQKVPTIAINKFRVKEASMTIQIGDALVLLIRESKVKHVEVFGKSLNLCCLGNDQVTTGLKVPVKEYLTDFLSMLFSQVLDNRVL